MDRDRLGQVFQALEPLARPVREPAAGALSLSLTADNFGILICPNVSEAAASAITVRDFEVM